MRLPVVDLDDQGTWPATVADQVRSWGAQLRGSTDYTSDLALGPEEESSFRALLGGHLLRAYHCTRLLDHEVGMIRERGLLSLSEDLLAERIEAAHRYGFISQAERDTFHRSHVFATREHRNREGQVCLILSPSVFDEHPAAVDALLSMWGGEGLYMADGAPAVRARLRELGRPAVVVALIDLAGGEHLVFPGVHNIFVGRFLGLHDASGDVFYRASIPPEHIEAIWQPGDPDYDCHEAMPR